MKKPDFKEQLDSWKACYATSFHIILHLRKSWLAELLTMIFVTLLFPVVFFVVAYLEADDAEQ